MNRLPQIDNFSERATPTQVFLDSTLPVVQHYEAGGKVARINADRDPADIYKEVRRLFLEF